MCPDEARRDGKFQHDAVCGVPDPVEEGIPFVEADFDRGAVHREHRRGRAFGYVQPERVFLAAGPARDTYLHGEACRLFGRKREDDLPVDGVSGLLPDMHLRVAERDVGIAADEQVDIDRPVVPGVNEFGGRRDYLEEHRRAAGAGVPFPAFAAVGVERVLVGILPARGGDARQHVVV